jgi:hypothetical protein
MKKLASLAQSSLAKADELGEIDGLLIITSTCAKAAEKTIEEGNVLLKLSEALKGYESKIGMLNIINSDIEKSKRVLDLEFKKAGRCPLCLQPITAKIRI